MKTVRDRNYHPICNCQSPSPRRGGNKQGHRELNCVPVPSPLSSFALPQFARHIFLFSIRRQFRVSDSSKLSNVLAKMVHAASSFALSLASRGDSPTLSRASALSPRAE